jgi:small subunit ribosomal protein S20
MPNSASAKKRLRQSLDRRDRNRAVRSNIRGQVKKLRTTITGGDVAACETEFRVTTKKLDQAAAKGILHANAAARLKSRLSAAIKAVKAKSSAAK